MSTDTYTRWAVIASGEGGGRIASQFFERKDNPGIEDRILLMNTNRADIRSNIDRIAEHARVDREKIQRNHTAQFGVTDGAGNMFHWGEENARQDEDRIIERIESAEIDDADAFLYLATLGGGTGCGSVPYLINTLQKDAPTPALSDTTHVALVAWPFEFDGPQMDFNAVAGMSRLMNWYDGSQNADIAIIVDNSHVSETVAEKLDVTNDRRSGLAHKAVVNELLIEVIDMMIAAGRETYGTTDVIDIMSWPAQTDSRHLTPGLALDMQTIYHFEFPFDVAAENTFAPIDPQTATGVFAFVRAPADKIGNAKFNETAVKRALNEWLTENGFNVDVSMQTLTPSPDKTDTFDVMLLFSGFDLDPLLERSMPQYEKLLDTSFDGQFMQKFDNPEKEYNRQDFITLQRNLENYLSDRKV